MAAGRWYPSVTPLRNGEMLITEGGPDTPEVRKTDGGLRALNSASLDLPLYPWIDVAPDGRAFYSGPDQTMRSLDTAGGGSWQSFGQRDTLNRDYGSHAIFDMGKILVAGGGSSSKDARVIDLNGPTPQVSRDGADGVRPPPAQPHRAGGRHRARHRRQLVRGRARRPEQRRLPGRALEPGHRAVADARGDAGDPPVPLHGAAPARRRVLSAGGGICGACDRSATWRRTPRSSPRRTCSRTTGRASSPRGPTITSAPDDVSYDAPFRSPRPTRPRSARWRSSGSGAVTHSVNMEQRYVPLSFTAGGGTINATAPANANIAPPGFYMLFVIDATACPRWRRWCTSRTAAPRRSRR